MNGGFVLIRRELLTHPVFRHEGEALQFAWLIARAAWKPTRVRYKDRVIHLARGQLAVSVRDMANALGQPRMSIHRFLERLKNETMIETTIGTGVNIITICNYAKYQDYGAIAGTGDGTGDGTQAGQARDTEQQYKQGEQDSLPPRGQGSKSKLPSDWKPPAVSELPPKAQQCARQWPPEIYEREAEGFALYWQSEGKFKKDWRATWANRIIMRHWAVMQETRRGDRRPSNEPQKLYEHMREGGR